MKHNVKFHFSNPRGFSLIELLVVIAIIGILSTFAMVNFMGVKQRARDAQRKSDLRQLQSAVELYKADQSTYPPAAQVVCGSPLKAGTATYMSKVPCDPAGSSFYNGGAYFYSTTGTAYTIGACLENGNDTGTDITTTSPGGSGTCASGKWYRVLSP